MQYDDMHNKLSLALESGKGAPDVVDIELGKFPSFTNGKIGLMDLTDAIAPYKDNIVESRLDIYGKDGKYYGLTISIYAGLAMFNESYMLWKGNNSPQNIGLTIVGYLYRQGIEKRAMGYACAVGLVLLIIVMVVNMIQLAATGTFKKEER